MAKKLNLFGDAEAQSGEGDARSGKRASKSKGGAGEGGRVPKRGESSSYVGPIVRVVLPVPVDEAFDYIIPEPLLDSIVRGGRVRVSFGRRDLIGFVTERVEGSPLPASKLKPILEVVDAEPLVDEGMMQLTRWMADYYACAWGEALEAVIPAVIRRNKAIRTVGVLRMGRPKAELLAEAKDLEERAGDKENSPLSKRAKVLRTIVDFEEEDFRPAVLAEKLGYSESPIRTLLKTGWLKIEIIPLEDSVDATWYAPGHAPGELNIEQERALIPVREAIERDEYKTFLLFGVTGSGKTEVYIHALMQAVEAGKSGIVLVPEISLTPQTVKRFSERLQMKTGVAVLHSAMTDKERRHQWKRIAAGEARVVIGPRSAVFAPVKDLGVIVVDEEHEPSYKQDNTPRYHARDVAVMRAHKQSAVCILGSATPSLESAFNALHGRYQTIKLKERVAGRPMAKAIVIDMAEECRAQKRFVQISNTLVKCTRDSLKAGHQAVMFLNRRGYNTFFQCDTCREAMICPNCSVPMSLHRSLNKLVCHYCYETALRPSICPYCKAGAMNPRGFGTEKLEEEIERYFPDARVGRMDSDVMKKREDYEDMLDRFREHEIDILVGTQMIAKGLDFPNVTVVGVIHADLNLYLADFRAQERTFQLLTQVAGRAGRGDAPGLVLVQTFTPDHPCIQSAQAQDFDDFLEYELRQRKVAKYPPYVRLLNITIEGRDKKKALETGRMLRKELDDLHQLEPGRIMDVLGPAEAPFTMIRGRHRFQLLVKVRDYASMAVVSERMRKHVKNTENLRVIMDVDPYSML